MAVAAGTVSPWCRTAASGAADQTDEGSVTGGALPEHAQQEGGKQRRVHDGKHQLQRIHDVVEAEHDVGRAHRNQDADDGGPSAHLQVVRVARALVDVGLVEVEGPDGIEGGDVAGHAGHEAGEQRGEAEAENAGGEVVEQHVGDGEVVVEDGLAVGVEHDFAGDGIDLGRDETAAGTEIL